MMQGRFSVISILLLISVISPLSFWLHYGKFTKESDSRYKLIATKDLDIYQHERFIFEASKNIKLGRFSTLTIIDEKNPIGSSPLFQYYGVGIYFVMGTINLVLNNPPLTIIVGIWLFAFALCLGSYLWAFEFSRDQNISLLVSFIVSSSPYFISSQRSYTQSAGAALLPLTAYFWSYYIRQGRGDFVLFWVTVGAITLEILTNNINALLGATFLSIPTIIATKQLFGPGPFPWRRAVMPILLALVTSSFYLVPIFLDYKKLVTSNRPLDTWNTMTDYTSFAMLFSPFPAKPDSDILSAWPQLGWSFIAASLLFYSRRTIVYYFFEAAGVISVLSLEFWNLLPGIYKMAQNSIRALYYPVLILVFQARPIKKIPFLVLTALSVISALMFYNLQTPKDQVTFDFALHKIMDSNSYMISPKSNVKLDRDPTLISFSNPISIAAKHWPMEISQLPIAKSENSATASYFLSISTSNNRAINHGWASIVTTYQDGLTHDSGPILFYKNTVLLSTCATGATDAHIVLWTDLDPRDVTGIQVLPSSDSQFMFFQSPEGVQRSTCSYNFDHSYSGFKFDVSQVKDKVILPVFYSPNNLVSTDQGPLSPEKLASFMDDIGQGFTVVTLSPEAKSVSVEFGGSNKLIYITFLVFLLMLVSPIYYFLRR